MERRLTDKCIYFSQYNNNDITITQSNSYAMISIKVVNSSAIEAVPNDIVYALNFYTLSTHRKEQNN